MKKFRVGVREETTGYVLVRSENKEKAKKIVQNMLDENGLDGIVDLKIWESVSEIVNKPEEIY